MKRIISTFLLIMCGFASTTALAHTPLAREVHVVIQSIDFDKKILTLTYDQGRGPQKLIWNADTQFLCNWKPVSATELKEGMRVTAFYHSPFFGRPFITKVVWEKGG